jgi:hypothetical protein
MPDNVGDVRDALEPYGYPDMRTTQRSAVTLTGTAPGRPMTLARGHGCDLRMCRSAAPAFAGSRRTGPEIAEKAARVTFLSACPHLSAPEETVDAIQARL